MPNIVELSYTNVNRYFCAQQKKALLKRGYSSERLGKEQTVEDDARTRNLVLPLCRVMVRIVLSMKKLFAFALLLALPAFAKDKTPYTYQDGVLQAVKRVVSGSSCNTNGNTTGTVDANTNSTGQTNGTVKADTQASTTCGNLYQWLYTVKTGDVVYILTPSRGTGAKIGTAVSLGWGRFFLKDSTMANQLPGTQIKLRSDASGIYVKVGERESLYRVVSAE